MRGCSLRIPPDHIRLFNENWERTFFYVIAFTLLYR